MTIQFHIRGCNVSTSVRHWLEQSVERLQRLTPVTATAVVLEHRAEDAPAYRAFASLAVPGPDIHAEARDHTLEAAWLKVISALRRQIEQRQLRRKARRKTHRQVIAPVGRSRRCSVGMRA